MKHIFIIGSKGIPAKYGGFETFVEKLTECQKSENIQYHVLPFIRVQLRTSDAFWDFSVFREQRSADVGSAPRSASHWWS